MNEIDSDGKETELGQHDRWMRQAPDLLERYDALKAEAADEHRVCDRLAGLLDGVSVAVNGPNPPGALWSFHDLPEKVRALADAIRAHRDARGDDRCWMDDEALYRVLPEGYVPPARDSAVELERCQQFVASRQSPATVYVSPQREIDRLTAENEALRRELVVARSHGL